MPSWWDGASDVLVWDQRERRQRFQNVNSRIRFKFSGVLYSKSFSRPPWAPWPRPSPRCQQPLAPSHGSPRSNSVVIFWNPIRGRDSQAHAVGCLELLWTTHAINRHCPSGREIILLLAGKTPATWVGTERNHPSQAKRSRAGLSPHWNSDSAWRILAELQLGPALVNVTTVSQITHSLNKT